MVVTVSMDTSMVAVSVRITVNAASALKKAPPNVLQCTHLLYAPDPRQSPLVTVKSIFSERFTEIVRPTGVYFQ